jgi:hypothetical protein
MEGFCRVHVARMNRHELALKIASHWIEVLGEPLAGKSVSVSFELSDDFLKEGEVIDFGYQLSPAHQIRDARRFTRETLPKAVAHLLRDGRMIPENEVRGAIQENAFDGIEVTLFQVPERDSVPKWVEEEYFVEGILRALLRLRYPDWDRRQLAKYAEKLIGRKRLRRFSFAKAVLYAGLIVSVVLFVNLGVFWGLNRYMLEGSWPSVHLAIMVEGLIIVFVGLTFVNVYDTMIYSPTGRIFYEHARFPPRTSVAVACAAAGVALFLIGLFLYA